jgi:integrase
MGAPSRSVRRAAYVVSSLSAFYNGLGIEDPPLTNPVIEAYCGKGLRAGQSSPTRGTYRSVLRRLSPDPRPPLAVSFRGSVAKPAYSATERGELWQIGRSQRRGWRRHSALCLIALSMGAGLRAGEVVAARREDLDLDAGVITVTGKLARRVPLSSQSLAMLCGLSFGDGFLFHPEQADRSYPNFVNNFCLNLTADPAAVRLCMARLRASYLCDHLAAGTPLAEILTLSGIKEVESLLYYSRQVESAPHSKSALRRALAAGL